MTTEEQLYLDIIKTIPVLRYQKDPAENIQALYNRYPNGGEYGWYALVRNTKGFVFWDTATSTWEVMKLSDGSAAFASQAEASALEAAASAVAALDSKNAAQTAETNSYNNRVNASDSQQAALASEQAAKASEEASALSAVSALASKDAAIGANNLAQAAKNDAVVAANNSELYASNAVISADSAEASAAAALLSENAAGYANYQAQGYATAAEASKDAAATSAAAAGLSEAAAEAAKDIAVAKGDQALISASNALTYQNEAMAARDLSETYRDSSLAAATSSQEARDKAELWANENENVAVEPGLYSAKHFMLKAEDQYLLAQAEKVAAQTARTGAETARAGAETAEANAELAESNAELAETNAEAARDAAIASAATFQATYPITVYQSRALADLGTIKDLDRLTELYMNNLNLLPYTHFMWDGNAGYKVVDGKLVKAYSMDNSGNDGTTTAGTEPYADALVAPNATMKIKNVGVASAKKISIPEISYAAGVDFTIDFEFTPNKIGDGIGHYIFLYHNGNTQIEFADFGGIYLIGSFSRISGRTYQLPTFVGKKNKIQFIRRGSSNEIWVNGKSALSILEDNAIYINQLDLNGFDGTINKFRILSKALSAYEIQLSNELAQIQHPEIEGIDIGNQHWATSNYEGVVTGNGTVIPEYKYNAANSPEIVPSASSTFETDGTAWWENFLAVKTYDSANQAMLVTSENDVYAQIYKTSNIVQNFQNNKIYHYKVDVKSNDYNGVLNIGYSRTLISTISNPAITNSYQTIEFFGTWGVLFAAWTNGTTLSIDNISVKEAGWDELTTPGWCYYNNDAALGAVYGKLYNWYAVAEIAKNPPSGWRVPSDGDWTQLQTYLGGSTVAGKKMKALHGGFDNSYSTNESGFSTIDTGFRTELGAFSQINFTNWLWSSNLYMFRTVSANNTFEQFYLGESKYGMSLRLLRNSPVGEDTKIISTGRFSTDISSTPKYLSIPFGYVVDKIYVNSTNTNTFTVFSKDAGNTLVNTVVDSVSVDANVITVLNVTINQRILLQDGYISIYANGNTGDGMIVEVVLKKIQ